MFFIKSKLFNYSDYLAKALGDNQGYKDHHIFSRLEGSNELLTKAWGNLFVNSLSYINILRGISLSFKSLDVQFSSFYLLREYIDRFSNHDALCNVSLRKDVIKDSFPGTRLVISLPEKISDPQKPSVLLTLGILNEYVEDFKKSELASQIVSCINEGNGIGNNQILSELAGKRRCYSAVLDLYLVQGILPEFFANEGDFIFSMNIEAGEQSITNSNLLISDCNNLIKAALAEFNSVISLSVDGYYDIDSKYSSRHIDPMRAFEKLESRKSTFKTVELGSFESLVDVFDEVLSVDEGWECGLLTLKNGEEYFYLTHPEYDDLDGEYEDEGENFPTGLDDEIKDFTYARTFEEFEASFD